uniref:Protein-S-isoprenylcysteine O-methyltransferase n=1 Tax=Meloidogyne enterolobii TaxID=390850 RepID=A0A6V7VW46_MELEN|nr:unnamed protein product [Meloidogyne enterolobii]
MLLLALHIRYHFAEAGITVFATDGVYALVRHPGLDIFVSLLRIIFLGYMGWMMWSIGTQLVLCNPICVISYAIVSYRFFEERIYEEERYLIEFFAERYIAYQRFVPTGIPGISGYEPTH